MDRTFPPPLRLPKTLFLLPLTLCSDNIDHLISEHIQALRRLYRPLQFWYDTPQGAQTDVVFSSTRYNARTSGVAVYAMERELERRRALHTPQACVEVITSAFNQSSLIYLITTAETMQKRIHELLVKQGITPQAYALGLISQVDITR